ncbi:MAG TPA: class I SAM-dependent methyltransferase [Saprospiraceae bacterium]|nr:class I SAM-dependent methyltransferase [Saprospiraceae bacterium]HMQ83245.1 class I SAM-dependent methyltransferase [Saprospiraceae bacterium]
MKFYYELADWWHLMSAPEEYEAEAGIFWEIITRHKADVKTALELGSGGGNNAFHLKHKCAFTLSDISPAMIQKSQEINPECAHHVGDMRTLDLQQTFDLVFIHDAIMFLTSEEDLLRVFEVAKKHLNPGGLLFITPDFFKETFVPSTDCDGQDDGHRSLRYLEWYYDKDPDDSVFEVEYVYLLKNGNEPTQCLHETYQEGLFSKITWERLLKQSGFEVIFEPIQHTGLEDMTFYGIVGKMN